MGYGSGKVGTGMHLMHGIKHRFRYTDEQLQAIARCKKNAHQMFPDISVCEVSRQDKAPESKVPMFEEGGAFDSSQNLAASIIAKLSGVPVQEIYQDTFYPVTGVENCVCEGQLNKFDSWSVFMPIFYDTDDHLNAKEPSSLAVTCDVDCDILCYPSEDPDVNSMRMEWFGPEDLLSNISGLMYTDEVTTPYGNTWLRPAPWIFEALERHTFLHLAYTQQEKMADALCEGEKVSFNCVINILEDVTRAIYKKIISNGWRTYSIFDIPQGTTIRNFKYVQES